MRESETEVLQQWRRRQFSLVNRSVMVLLIVIVSLNIFVNGLTPVSQILVIELATVFLAQRLFHIGMLDAAMLLLVGSLTFMVSATLWMMGSARVFVVLAYPTILIIASLLLRLPSFLAVSAYMSVSVVVIGVAEIRGVITNESMRVSRPDEIADILIILLAAAICSWILSNDLRRALARVSDEIVKQRESHRRIEFLANHDSLTGLPNRHHAMGRIEQVLAASRRSGQRAALLFLDLDNFKTINDSLGHDAGDELLRQTAERLRSCVREEDVVSRHGGDEFLVLLAEVGSSHDAEHVAQKILEGLCTHFQVGGRDVVTSSSIGIAMFPNDGENLETLVRNADSAMYQAKEEGRNAYRLFTPQMNQDYIEALALKNDLRQAIERGEFVLHYQPQVRLCDGAVTGAEALVRWRHPRRGLLPPGAFIGLAESTGMIAPLGHWILREACAQAMAWQRSGLPSIVMAVNLSALQFKRDPLQASIESILTETGLPPDLLTLELTESVIIKDAEDVLQTIRHLKGLGVQLAIDDFGTGYSSLAYLRRFAVDKIKIDQSFVREMAHIADSAAIVRAIVDMAGSLSLKTIAEGVEDQHTLEILEDLGCDEVQGYHLARPMAPEAFSSFLNERRAPLQAVLH